jgi:hypothetical protein
VFAIHLFTALAATVGSRSLILCLVRPMRYALAVAAILLVVVAPLVASDAEIVIHRSDVTGVQVDGASVTVSARHGRSASTDAHAKRFAIRLAFVVSGAKDAYISGASFGESSLSVTLRCADPASAAEFAASITRGQSGE